MLLLIIILSVRFNTQFRVKMSTHTFTSLFPSLLTKKYLSYGMILLFNLKTSYGSYEDTYRYMNVNSGYSLKKIYVSRILKNKIKVVYVELISLNI